MKSIGEVTDRVTTWNPKRAAGQIEFSYIDLSAVDNQRKQITAPVVVTSSDAPSRARQLVSSGDVLVSTVRPNLNAVAVVPPELDGATASTGFTVLRPDSGTNSRYLFHWVRSDAFVADMVRRATGASYPAVSDRIVKASRIPVPPLDEQRRVAAILDQADAVRDKRRRALDVLKRLAESIFAEFFSLPAASSVALGEVANKVVVGHVGPTSAHFRPTGVPFLRTGNVGEGQVVRSDLAFVTHELHAALKKSQLRSGDVLISRVITDRVRAAILPPELDGANCANIIVVRPSENILGETVLGFLGLASTQRALLGCKVGSAQGVVNTTVLKELMVPLHSVKSQRDLTDRLGAIRQQRALLKNHLEALEVLFKSFQSRAFGGGI